MKNVIFQQLGDKSALEKALAENLIWIEKSCEKNNGSGSSAYRTMLGQWAKAYPETTGYLIPTLINASKYLDDNKWKDLASQQIIFLKNIQNKDGSFPQSMDNTSPIIFDTAQILLGLCAYQESYGGNKTTIETTYHWLVQQLNNEGIFQKYNFIKNYNPNYYSRVFWPMLWATKILNETVPVKIFNGINHILADEDIGGQFKNWRFKKGDPAFSHTIVYTLRGLWECGQFLGNEKIISASVKNIDALCEKISDKGLAGAYDNKFIGDFSFICSAGNAQLTVLLLKVYKNTTEEKYLSSIPKLLKPLLNKQSDRFFNKGAIPSSIPVYGKYQRFKYTNWTQKFFADSILELLRA